MSDEELTAFLRDLPFLRAAEAADRIEALTEQLEAARADAKEAEAYAEELQGDLTELCRQLIATEDKLATCEKYRDAYDKMGRIGTEAYRDLEAKLAKAVEGLDKAAALIEDRHVVYMTLKGRNPKDYISDLSLIAKEVRAMLAEIESSTSEGEKT